MEHKKESAPVLKVSAEALRLMDDEAIDPASFSRIAAFFGRRGGIVKTAKKTAACRLNGLRGGRPRKSSS